MEIVVRREKTRVVMEIKGRIDTKTEPEFTETALKLLEDGTRELWLDLAEVVYLSSIGLRGLFIIARASKAKKIPVLICRSGRMVRDTLEMSGYDSFFEMRNGLEV